MKISFASLRLGRGTRSPNQNWHGEEKPPPGSDSNTVLSVTLLLSPRSLRIRRKPACRLARWGGGRVDKRRPPGHDEGSDPTHPAKEPAMPFSHLPALLSSWFALLAAALDRRSAPRLVLLFCGALFARCRRP